MLTQREYWMAAGCPNRHATQLILPKGQAVQWDAAYAWAARCVAGGGIVALIGDRGTGKTQIGVELIRKATMLTNPPKRSRYIRAAEMYGQIRDALRADHANEGKAIQLWTAPWLLVIDEAHERSATSDFEPRILNLILDKRYGECRPTIIVANVIGDTDEAQAESFRKLIGETIFDRLSETGGIRPCNWKSFRVKGDECN